MMVLQSPDARSRASVACHAPGAGCATSAYQKYGGPPRRSRVLVATLPFGAISDSSPSIGFSEATTTRSGAPFQGDSGEGSTVTSAASSQLAAGPWAHAATGKRKAEHAVATSSEAAAVAQMWRAGINGVPPSGIPFHGLGKRFV